MQPALRKSVRCDLGHEGGLLSMAHSGQRKPRSLGRAVVVRRKGPLEARSKAMSHACGWEFGADSNGEGSELSRPARLERSKTGRKRVTFPSGALGAQFAAHLQHAATLSPDPARRRHEAMFEANWGLPKKTTQVS